mmetsp:Transcript_18966/g.18111  ORF Transcript_18966/g.18111 Transcript_18966/m.18111 type:complete len:92 (+) Transcript_18966:397-672(+)
MQQVFHDYDLHHASCLNQTDETPGYTPNVCVSYKDCIEHKNFFIVLNLYDEYTYNQEIFGHFCCANVDYYFNDQPNNVVSSYPVCIPRMYT